MAAKAKVSSLATVKQILATNDPAPAYLFHGSEEKRINDVVAHLRKTLQSLSDGPLSWSEHDIAESGFGAFLDDLRTVSFFGGRRGVHAYNIDSSRHKSGIRLTESEQEQFLAYLQNPSPDVTLVITVAKVDMRSTFWKKLAKCTTSALFESTEQDRKMMMAEKIAATGLAFAPDAKIWVSEQFANNLPQLDKELEKLSVYMGDRKKVTLEDIETCMSSAKSHTVFQLVKAIGMRKIDDSLRALQSLKRQGEPIVLVVAMIARQFRILLIIKSCMEQKMSREETVRRSKVAPFFFNEYQQQTAGLSLQRIKQIICTLSAIGLKTRTSSMNDWLVLEEEIVFLISSSRQRMNTKS